MGRFGRSDVEEGKGRVWWIAAGAAAVAGIALLLMQFRGDPQIGADEEAFKAVDALFTAVTARDGARLAECEARLHGLRDAARLSETPCGFLDGVIAEARGGEWEPAAKRLYEFMLAQRRE